MCLCCVIVFFLAFFFSSPYRWSFSCRWCLASRWATPFTAWTNCPPPARTLAARGSATWPTAWTQRPLSPKVAPPGPQRICPSEKIWRKPTAATRTRRRLGPRKSSSLSAVASRLHCPRMQLLVPRRYNKRYPSTPAVAVASAPPGASAEALPVEVTLAIQGMTCNSCVAAVTNALRKVPGVVAAEVALHPRGLAWVTASAGGGAGEGRFNAEKGGCAAVVGSLVDAVTACGFSAQPEGVKDAPAGARLL